MKRCDAHHDGHDCQEIGACTRALLAMLERVDSRTRRAPISGRTPGELKKLLADDSKL